MMAWTVYEAKIVRPKRYERTAKNNVISLFQSRFGMNIIMFGVLKTVLNRA